MKVYCVFKTVMLDMFRYENILIDIYANKKDAEDFIKTTKSDDNILFIMEFNVL